jgi:hypothetical protein
MAEISQVMKAEVRASDYVALDPVHRKQVLDTIKLLDGRPPAPLPPLIELAMSITKDDKALQARLMSLKADVDRFPALAKADPNGWQLINTMREDGVAKYIVQMVKGASKGDPVAQAKLDKFSKSALDTPLGVQALVVRDNWWEIFGECMHRADMPCRRANRALEGDSMDEALQSLKDEAHWDDKAINFARAMTIPVLVTGAAISSAMGGNSPSPGPTGDSNPRMCNKVTSVVVWNGIFGSPVAETHSSLVPCY